MKNLKDKIDKAKNTGLPQLRKLKNIPEWCDAYPDFCDKIEELWDNGDKLFVSTLIYFMTNDKHSNKNDWNMIKMKIKDLYHK